MAHPLMFEDDDPFLRRLRDVALALPGADEKVSHGRPAFFTTKVFAYFGGSLKVDGQWEQHDRSAIVLADPDEREALVADDRFFVPAYLGPSGWVGLDLEPLGDDWSEVEELVESSYRATAGARRVRELDARRP
ncbi:MmcQ/YjbR family DNA-binding protein [Oryzobacter terrae]|uniref:MmcQ/YjbR family DNA-binding protein n=1 Tax=Oryzobacter terrae TaxID=1620385 RepID=UPI00366C2EA8